MYPEDIGQSLQKEATAASFDVRPDIRKNITRARANAEKEMERCDSLLKLLDRNPDVTEILQLLGQGGRF